VRYQFFYITLHYMFDTVWTCRI